MCSRFPHPLKRVTARVTAVLAMLSTAGTACRTGQNYPPEGVPRSSAPVRLAVAATHPRVMPDSLRVVTFNIKYAVRVNEAIAVLATDRTLANADVIFLQEMDAPATARIADALGLGYVYYPSTRQRRSQRDFGNAVLSRWPIIADERLVLPHHSRFTRTQRVATAATIQVGHRAVRVYSVHLGIVTDISPDQRRDQLEFVIRDAMRFPYVIIGGDMNARGVGPAARSHGYDWMTERNGRTTRFGRWDHFFTRGFAHRGEIPTGVSRESRAASDHHAVWMVLPMRASVGR